MSNLSRPIINTKTIVTTATSEAASASAATATTTYYLVLTSKRSESRMQRKADEEKNRFYLVDALIMPPKNYEKTLCTSTEIPPGKRIATHWHLGKYIN